ncbi:MAG: DUF997 family protein [bacterium]
MRLHEDPRVHQARRMWAIAWIFYSVFVACLMGFSYTLGVEPLIWGLPRWVAIGQIVVPIVFVLGLIAVAEKLIPDLPVTDEEETGKGAEK